MKKSQVREYRALRRALAADFFKYRCFVCRKNFGVRFQFHHLWYIQTDKKYNHFANPLEYTQHLAEQIRADSKRFLLLCRTHHRAIEVNNSFKPENWRRMQQAVRMTRT